MRGLPDIVRQYLQMTRAAADRLVWILLDLEGRVTDWGGDIELLAPRRLTVGRLATEQLVGLTGIVPVGERSVVIPGIQLEPGLIVDLHAFPSPVGACLVLLDAAPEHEEKRKKQQQSYDEKLAKRAAQRKR
jgi:hypothetical protein